MLSVRVKPDLFQWSDQLTKPAKPIENVKGKLKELQLQLVTYQQACFQQNKRVLLVFEGTDTAGKGGAIRRLTRYLDLRGVHVWPIGAPQAHEHGHHYLHRFWTRMPDEGQIAIFDRSWYGRVLVERVENFATDAEWQRAYKEIRDFERLFTDDGVMVLKFYFHLSKGEQKKRLISRIREPSKRWKITPADLTTRNYWDEYQDAFKDMLLNTSTSDAPWFLIPADDKDHARFAVLNTVVEEFKAFLDATDVQILDPEVAKIAEKHLGKGVLDDI